MIPSLAVLVASAVAGDPDPSHVVQPGSIADGWCSACGELATVSRTAKASSTLTEGKLVFASARAVDGRPDTAWCEGIEGPGLGEWLEIELGRPLAVEAVQIWSGYFLDAERLAANGRPSTITVEIADARVTVAIQDPTIAPDPLPCPSCGDWFETTRRFPFVLISSGDGGDLWPEEPVRRIRIRIDGAHSGTKHADTCISEVKIDAYDPAAP